MNVFICECEKYCAGALRKAISKWASFRNIDLEFYVFKSPQELWKNLFMHPSIDVLFLDVFFGKKEMDGITLDKFIRKSGNTTPIIFVTSNSLRAADGYLVEAMAYVTKPLDENRLALFMDRILNQTSKSKTIKIISDSKILIINTQDIIFVEVKDHTIEFNTIHRILKQRGTLSKTLTILGENFLRVHRSYIISLDKIYGIKTTYPYNVSLLNRNQSIELPVSRKYINNLLAVYSDDFSEM